MLATGGGQAINRLGAMGGSFDPVHLAHLLAAERVREALALDLVLFVPTAVQPLKQERPVAPAEHRVAMLELAISGNPAFALSRVDVDRAGPSYTVDTVGQLRREWEPQAGGKLDMWFIIGADSLATLPMWRDPAGILACTRLAVVQRPGARADLALLAAELPGLAATVDLIDSPLVDISATDIRSRVREGRSIKYRVPDSVREYIAAHALYK